MKKLLFSTFILFSVIICSAQNGKKVKGEQIGTAIINENVMDVKNVVQRTQAEENIASIRVAGKVVDVCQVKGCWMKLENPGGEAVHIMFKDYALFMPKDLAGKNVVLEGRAYINYTTVAELQHFAEDAGKSKEEIAKINEPKREVRIEAWGVTIINE